MARSQKQNSERYCIQDSFSNKHNFYRYVCKSDQEVAHSKNHPLLTADSPKMKNSSAGFRAACATKRKSVDGESRDIAKKWKSLTNLDLSKFIQERVVKSYTEIIAIAEEQRTTDQMNIAEFVLNKTKKIHPEVATKTWQM